MCAAVYLPARHDQGELAKYYVLSAPLAYQRARALLPYTRLAGPIFDS